MSIIWIDCSSTEIVKGLLGQGMTPKTESHQSSWDSLTPNFFVQKKQDSSGIHFFQHKLHPGKLTYGTQIIEVWFGWFRVKKPSSVHHDVWFRWCSFSIGVSFRFKTLIFQGEKTIIWNHHDEKTNRGRLEDTFIVSIEISQLCDGADDLIRTCQQRGTLRIPFGKIGEP